MALPQKSRNYCCSISVKEQNSGAIVAHPFNASTRDAEAVQFEFEVCGASPRATRAKQRKPKGNKATALCEEGAH